MLTVKTMNLRQKLNKIRTIKVTLSVTITLLASTTRFVLMVIAIANFSVSIPRNTVWSNNNKYEKRRNCPEPVTREGKVVKINFKLLENITYNFNAVRPTIVAQLVLTLEWMV